MGISAADKTREGLGDPGAWPDGRLGSTAAVW